MGKRTCDELGVCKKTFPRCKGCRGCEPVSASVFQGLLGYGGDAVRIMQSVPLTLEFKPVPEIKTLDC